MSEHDLALAARIAEQDALIKDLVGALEWYEERARQMADGNRTTDYHLAVLKEIELDGGKRARAALARATKESG